MKNNLIYTNYGTTSCDGEVGNSTPEAINFTSSW